MPQIEEAGRQCTLFFSFPPNWVAASFDKTGGFYRQKVDKINAVLAVDIVAAAPHEGLVQLIEVKDYRQANTDLWADFRSGELTERLVWKAVHSVSSLFLGATVGKDMALLPFQQVLAQPPRRIEFIFFLEQDGPTKISDPNQSRGEKAKLQNRHTMRQAFTKKLREKLEPLGLRVALASQAELPPLCPWSVHQVA